MCAELKTTVAACVSEGLVGDSRIDVYAGVWLF